LPNTIEHPVIQPLREFDAPVMLWWARALRPEFFAPYSTAYRPLYVDAYGENNTQIYRVEASAVLTPNIGIDDQGRLMVGALAENVANQSRIAVFGDSKIFQNDYGLAPITGTQTPIYADNYALAQGVAGWLLGLPVELWQPLPSTLTWIAIDGSGADWDNQRRVTPDAQDDSSILPQNIRQVRSFRNQDFLYLQIETVTPPDTRAPLLLEINTDVNGDIDRSFSIYADNVFQSKAVRKQLFRRHRSRLIRLSKCFCQYE